MGHKAIRIVSVVGARPNFMKVAPLGAQFGRYPRVQHAIVHTGQHYDRLMSDVFFEQLGIAAPERHLGVGSGGHGEMTGKIMIAFEQVCLEMKPDLVIVVGDVNSTIAASLVARKQFVPVAHVEAGLRSFDETMPEELNRRLTDHLSNMLFATEPAAVDNLRREGVDMGRVHLVGDVMLETLQTFLPAVKARRRWRDFQLEKGEYFLVTIHRPSNVDNPEPLGELLDIFQSLPLPVIFPAHPRTVERIRRFGLAGLAAPGGNLRVVPPETYFDFLSLLEGSSAVLTDSGSLPAEAACFDTPCLVCRANTERPIYFERGSAELVGRDRGKIQERVGLIRAGQTRKCGALVRELGTDVSRKIVEIVADYLGVNALPGEGAS